MFFLIVFLICLSLAYYPEYRELKDVGLVKEKNFVTWLINKMFK